MKPKSPLLYTLSKLILNISWLPVASHFALALECTIKNISSHPYISCVPCIVSSDISKKPIHLASLNCNRHKFLDFVTHHNKFCEANTDEIFSYIFVWLSL